MTLSIREKRDELNKIISIIENYLRDYAKDNSIKTLDDMVHDIVSEYDVHVRKHDIIESIEAMDLHLVIKQTGGDRKRYVVFEKDYRRN